MMSVKINHNDISNSQILRISQGEKTKDVMSLWDKIKDWFQSNKREKALKTVENIVYQDLFDDKNHFKMLYHVLMLKTMASDAYKERIKIDINDNDRNITISIDNYNISITDIDNKQLNKMSTIINAFNRHSSIFSNEIALKCLYEKLDKNELNDQVFAELYIELDNKIRSGEMDLKQLNNKKPRLGELFSHLLSRNKIIKEDSVDITLKLNKGQLVSLGGKCSYNFY
ncbi:TPA: hypothetical protein ACKREM_001084 [Proteus mirabilis]